jgi:hypothetical protein
VASYDFKKPNTFPAMQPFEKVGTGAATPTLKKFFFQRAYNTVWAAYETWISEGAPQPTPPSGDAITGLTTAGFWKQVI